MNEKYEVLDEDWINEFEKTDKLFQDFYLDDIYYTEVHFIYINTSNDIEKIKDDIDIKIIRFFKILPSFIIFIGTKIKAK
jgi:hypothetical protein